MSIFVVCAGLVGNGRATGAHPFVAQAQIQPTLPFPTLPPTLPFPTLPPDIPTPAPYTPSPTPRPANTQEATPSQRPPSATPNVPTPTVPPFPTIGPDTGIRIALPWLLMNYSPEQEPPG